MPTEISEISIYDALKKGGFESSLILTYNAFLPFYEEVVLRKLQSSGCRNNILMMDRSNLSECLSSSSLRPRYAGSEYTLLPVQAAASFHPKIILLVGEKKGLVLVGSHNMTISGISFNREVTTQLDVRTTVGDDSLVLACDVWSFIEEWIEFQRGKTPGQLLEAVSAVKNMAPWIDKRVEKNDSPFRFIGSSPQGQSLWDKIRGYISGEISRVTVIGPFFDKGFAFLKTMQKQLSPREIFVGIDPTTVEMPEIPKGLNGIRFVDASNLLQRTTYLHAKAIYLESESKNNWLITGSANPSNPAWTASPGKRNAEAVILHSGTKAFSAAASLSIIKVQNYPEITTSGWNEIAERLKKRKKKDGSSYAHVIIATADNRGFSIPANAFETADFIKANCINERNQILMIIQDVIRNKPDIILPLEPDLQRGVRAIEIHLKKSKILYVLVHNTLEIARRCESSRQAMFRKAMASLDSENPDLESLIRVVEKVVFDDTQDITQEVRRSSKKSAAPSRQSDDELISLDVHLKDTKKAKKHRRIINSGDLALIMDYLIHNLGVGLLREPPKIDPLGRDEEDLIGSDDEVEDIYIKIDDEALVRMCNNKVHNIVTRMLKQMERIKKMGKQYSHPIMQLVAVLALLRQLRKLDIEKEWVPKGKTLVPDKELKRLFLGVLPYLYGKSHDFIKKAKEELVDEPLDEISRLNGLMLWLAWKCGNDLRKPKPKTLGVDYERDFKKNIERAQLLLITPDAVSDDLAFEEAGKSIRQTAPNENRKAVEDWISLHRYWGKEFIKFKKVNPKKLSNANKSGDIGFRILNRELAVAIILREGQYVSLFDVEKPDYRTDYSPDNIRSISFPHELND